MPIFGDTKIQYSDISASIFIPYYSDTQSKLVLEQFLCVFILSFFFPGGYCVCSIPNTSPKREAAECPLVNKLCNVNTPNTIGCFSGL